ncbi:hypothetical protein LRS13_09980 [Svornostia abyssi]|uniref:Secreted protein n=1 Tax=Svornostia abyssi TaxID=2898438 RepID=A0ABY5PMJ0_9ACTN|nr:hypothetical protein LRS13_09980 [Parviterribacteraceae bacterium J379]
MSTIHRLATAVAAASLLAAAGAPGALAKDGDVRVAGSCSASATSKLKLSPENGRIETEFEVDQNRNGVTWRVTLTQNGVQRVSTLATTVAPSGSFELRRLLPNTPGADRVTARAVSPSGQVCTASASL